MIRIRSGRLLSFVALAAALIALALPAFGANGATSIAATSGGPETDPHSGLSMPAQFQEGTPASADLSYPSPDLACRLCHGDSQSELAFPSGESVPVQVDLATLADSPHGRSAEDPLLCTSCHVDLNRYRQPHEPPTAEDYRAYQLEQSDNCTRCHQDPHLTSHPGTDDEMPVACVDCHGAHDMVTQSAWQAGEGTDTCVACHEQAEVPRTDPAQLTRLIQNNLFADDVDNDYCLSCHGEPGLSHTFPNGDVLPLLIDATALNDSVHGADNAWQPLACTDCHEEHDFPHPPLAATSRREYALERYPVCATCHETNYENALDSAHGHALEEGNADAAVCTDCHGAHDTPPPSEPRERVSHTCEQCHSTIFEDYAESVHGAALLAEHNPDVPTCIDCHGVHNISDPTTSLFRIRSPELCAGCHADEELMAQYDISTNVFDSYVADFHGTTVTLFEHQDPTVETNKAVCYDCHGVHDIKPPDDPEAGIRANLLETCQQCHPDANAQFPSAWTSHFEPSPDSNPLVYYINLFYQIVIPLTITFLGVLVASDVYRRARFRLRRPRN